MIRRGGGRGGKRGLVVALIGPDGAGKTTLARALAADGSLHARRFYMGTNPASRDVPLPGSGKSFVHRLAGQWYRYALARSHRRRGGVVVFDRYLYAPRMLDRPGGVVRRAKRWLMRIGAPKPDIVVVLDAPSEVLLHRKGEHGVERLEQMRRDYARLHQRIPEAVLLDAARAEDEVRATLVGLLRARIEAPIPAASGRLR